MNYFYIMDNEILYNISEIRKKLGLSQESMSLELGVSQSHYWKIEKGATTLTVKHLEKIAGIFKIRIIDLYTYPKQYVDPDEIFKSRIEIPIKATLQIELSEEKRDFFIKNLFGDHGLELLNK